LYILYWSSTAASSAFFMISSGGNIFMFLMLSPRVRSTVAHSDAIVENSCTSTVSLVKF
jgi:hypothetical protein